MKGQNKHSDYLLSNYELTKQLYDSFINSKAQLFIYFSSVKAVTEESEFLITEKDLLRPKTSYGISKMLAEEYIIKKDSRGKKFIILRPPLIFGKGNKGNLGLIEKISNYGLPWPYKLGDNKKSLLYIENLTFILEKILTSDIPSGVYNISDEEKISTLEIIETIYISNNHKFIMLPIPKVLIKITLNILSLIFKNLKQDILLKLESNLELDSSKLRKNLKIKLPFSTKDGLKKTYLL